MQTRNIGRPRTKLLRHVIVACLLLMIGCIVLLCTITVNEVIFVAKRRHLCKSSVPVRTFSTPRDLLYTCVLKKNHWYDITLLSVRTSGCKAKIALVTEIDHDFGRFFELVLRYTDTDVYRVNPPEKGSRDI